ncbi:divalent cation tolerance protein CutA [candidate division KSB1 bacterium]|nr:divalent cation tolerance protein CutA [candidate division KSB1 bacterium]
MQYIIILITCSSADEAEKISAALLDEKLIACANIVPGIQSLFRWQGEMSKENEVLLILKSTAEKFEPVELAVQELHSYDTPEIIAIPIVKGSEKYLKWISDETR